MTDLGKRIKQLRTDCHYTQEDLAKILHVTSRVVSSWERGECNVPIDAMRDMANLFHVPMESIIGSGKLNSSETDLVGFVIENSFPDKLKELMASKHMDTYMLADRTGISEERLDSYAYSRRQPMAEDLIKLSEFFEVSIDWMLDISRRKSISAEEENLLHYYALMSDECKKLLSSEAYLLYVKGISGVAAPEYGRCLDPEKKSYPSNGTEGKKGA